MNNCKKCHEGQIKVTKSKIGSAQYNADGVLRGNECFREGEIYYSK